MKTFIILFAFVAVTLAEAPLAYVNVETDNQGHYILDYSSKQASRKEERFRDGRVIGSYNYFDTDGLKHTITYVAAGEAGFTAHGADIPVSPKEIASPVPEGKDIINARREHLALVAKEKALHPSGIPQEKQVPLQAVLAKLNVPEISSLPSSAVPDENADSVAAKAKLLKAYSEALKRLEDEYRRTNRL